MVTARAQLVSGNLFLKNSNCCPAEKSVLGELDWFSGENFPSKKFPLEKFLPRKVSAGNFSAGKSFQQKTFRRTLFRLPAEISMTEIYQNSGFQFIFSGNYNFRRKKFWRKIGCPVTVLDLKRFL